MSDKAFEVFKQVHALTAQQKLRVATMLLDRGQPDRAESIIEVALTQIRGERTLGKEAYARAVQKQIQEMS